MVDSREQPSSAQDDAQRSRTARVITCSDTLPPVPGGYVRETVSVGDRAFQLARPGQPDDLLDDPEVHARHNRDGFMPYWAWVWPIATLMAEKVLTAGWPPGTRVLEIGAGVGLTGLAALAAGCRVTFSDYSESAVQLCLHNARQNGLEADGLLLDWNEPPAMTFPVIIGCEVIYEARLHPLILDVFQRMLAADGVAWIGDPGRQYAEGFVRMARAAGFHVTVRDDAGHPHDLPQQGHFALIELRHAR